MVASACRVEAGQIRRSGCSAAARRAGRPVDEASAFQVPPTRQHREATQLLEEFGDEAKLLAGGQSLVPMLSLRLAFFDHLIHISRLADMQGIEERGDSVYVGAGTTESAVETHAGIAQSVPLLARSTPYIGHFQSAIAGPWAARSRTLTRPGISSGGARARRGTGLRIDAAVSARSRPPNISPGCGQPRWNRTKCWSASASPLGTDAADSPWRSLPGDTAISRLPVRWSAYNSTRMTGCSAAPSGFSAWVTPLRASAAEREAVGRPVSEIDSAELGEHAMAGLEEVPERLAGICCVPTAGRCGNGDAGVCVRAQRGARGGAPWLSSRSR